MSAKDASIRVLFVGGTGTISAASVRRAVSEGMAVTVLNRGRNLRSRTIPDVEWIEGDMTDPDSRTAALAGREFDCVINFLTYGPADAERDVQVFRNRTRHYIHISSASVYGKPVLSTPIVEAAPIHNRYLAYARAKIGAERVFLDAFNAEGFPVTIVRPSHTYDEARPPLPGDWTVVDRLLRGAEIVVHGDGTSLWTLTHADDLAVGLVGLAANPRAIGETFHITSDDVYTWDQIYTIVAHAFGVEAKLLHLASTMFPIVAPDWGWSDFMVGDLGHSAVFDNTKIGRFVPAFAPTIAFHRAARTFVEWRAAHPDSTRADVTVDTFMDRLVDGHRAAAAALADVAAKAR